jgi:hypothetical protein
MKHSVFFSWQSDIRAAACRTLIQDALEGAATIIGRDQDLGIDPVIDRDTQDVPGSPDIGATIFGKIETASVFVADVTIVNAGSTGRPVPNPNVLIELGYALKALGDRRIILVQNTAFGGPELLPFDLRQKRVTTYSSPADAAERATERRALQGRLEGALRDVLRQPAPARAEVELELSYAPELISEKLHRYKLAVSITNTSARRIDDWQVDLEFPTPFVEPGIIFAAKVADQSNEKRSLFRFRSGPTQPLQFGQTRTFTIQYRVDDALFSKRDELFSAPVLARGFVDGKLASVVERPFQELQRF